ncbi:hypothetical protein OIO90_001416 [Microbotryomycetes sp. JL221]|nr:hypothetical protein OIO90_001416 [Microbotryomycetes sp. JL221]
MSVEVDQDDDDSMLRAPFGLGRLPECGSNCTNSNEPLDLKSCLADLVNTQLTTIFVTFFQTCLRYLGVNEVLDYLEQTQTIDLWILTALNQGWSLEELTLESNLQLAKQTFTNLVMKALKQDDETWANSLKETAFSSAMSMAFQGIMNQFRLKQGQQSNVCLHTLLSIEGLEILESAPLKQSFPTCPPRTTKICSKFLKEQVKMLFHKGLLKGFQTDSNVASPTSTTMTTLKSLKRQLRQIYKPYQTLIKQISNEIVMDLNFSKEFKLFLESIVTPLNLFQLISEDFQHELGSTNSKGLLGINEVGGSNLFQIMDFCAMGGPSEVLNRVMLRLEQQQQRDDINTEIERKQLLIQMFKHSEFKLFQEQQEIVNEILNEYSDDDEEDEEEDIMNDIDLQEHQELSNAVISERQKLEQERDELIQRVRELDQCLKPLNPSERNKSNSNRVDNEFINEKSHSKQGSSKDLLQFVDPFSSIAPRVVSKAQSAKSKGKVKALTRSKIRLTLETGTNSSTIAAAADSMSRSSTRSISPVLSRKDVSPVSTTPTSPSTHDSFGLSRKQNKVSPPKNLVTNRRQSLTETLNQDLNESEFEDQENRQDQVEQNGNVDFNCGYCEHCSSALMHSVLEPVLISRSLSIASMKPSKVLFDEMIFNKDSTNLKDEVKVGVDGGGADLNRDEQVSDKVQVQNVENENKMINKITTTTSQSNGGKKKKSKKKLNVDNQKVILSNVEPRAVDSSCQMVDVKQKTFKTVSNSPSLKETTLKPVTKTTNSDTKKVKSFNDDKEAASTKSITKNDEPSSSAKSIKSTNLQPQPQSQSQIDTTKTNNNLFTFMKTLSSPLSNNQIFGLKRNHELQPNDGFTHSNMNYDEWIPMSTVQPPKSCPPDRCTGVKPNFQVWHWLDNLLFQTCLAGFKYELIYNMAEPLSMIRSEIAQQYLLCQGRMTTDNGSPIDMLPLLQQLNKEGNIWSSILYKQVRNFTRRTLGIALIKLISVFAAQLGSVCICTLSHHPDILANALTRLHEGEKSDRNISIQLEPIDQQAFIKWCHQQLRLGNLKGSEWEGLERQCRLNDYLFSIEDAFNVIMDDMMLKNPYSIADDIVACLEWLGGIRLFDVAMRLCVMTIDLNNHNDTTTSLEPGHLNDEVLLPVDGPLACWERMVDLSVQVRSKGDKVDKLLAESEKQRGNEHFAARRYKQAILSFSTASMIDPSDAVYWTNSAAARVKLVDDGHMSQTISDCTIALELDSSNLKALYRRAVGLNHLEMFEEAIKDLTRLVRMSPNNEAAKELLQQTKSRAKQFGYKFQQVLR